jgi:5-methylcytosine-specific restriction endonuclease McrA
MGRSPAYIRYLHTTAWRDKRAQVLTRDRYQCRWCGSVRRLQVHHKRYTNLGHEPLRDLVTLCARCHGVADRLRRFRGSMGRVARWWRMH